MKSECEGAAEFSTRSTRSTRLIQNAERSSVYSVRERSDLSVKFCGKKGRGMNAAVFTFTFHEK